MLSAAQCWRRRSSSATMPVCLPTASPTTASIGCGRTIDSGSSATWRRRCGSSQSEFPRRFGGPTCIASSPLLRTSIAPHSSPEGESACGLGTSYFIDLFSPETYERFTRSSRDVSGFRLLHKNMAEPERILATVLFADIVASTDHAAHLGDHRWHELLDGYYDLARRELARFRGREIDTAGDGFFAAFDGPARAVRCAQAIAKGVRTLGIEVRAGCHTGECEIIGEKLGGIAVHIGARVAAVARPGEVLVSNTVKDLVAGSGLAFEERGAHNLKGVPGEWRLYAVPPTA